MTRSSERQVRKIMGLAVAGILTLCPLLAKGNAPRPNVLFIAVDDLRPELGCYNAGHIKSPEIDKLAASGTVFKRAYCQVAVCGASRASLLTGLRPTPARFLTYYTHAEKDAPGAMTLPEEFRKNGYHCISNGKVFHHRDDTGERSWSEPAWRPSISALSTLDPASKTMVSEKGRGPVFEAPDVPDSAYPDGQIADKTIHDLKRMKRDGKPFFLACGFQKPHLPFYAPKKYWDLYDRDRIAVADNQYRPKNAPRSLKGSGEFKSYHLRHIEVNSDQWHRSMRHGYYACVSYIDAQIGRILKTLDQLDLRKNTIIILWGDHGWHLGEHNFWGKHNVMHLSTNSPLIVAAPGFGKGQQSTRLVEFVDIYPTLCDLAGITTVNQGLQGTSFKPLLSEPARSWKKAVFSKFGPAVSVITERYNYGEFKNGERMLYDLEKDISENVNIAEEAEHRELVGELSQRLKTLEIEVTSSLLYEDRFEGDLNNWVVEQMPGGTVRVNDGKLEIEDAKGCTVWFRKKLDGPVMIEYEAVIIKQGGPHDRGSDLNCFWMAQDPEAYDKLFAGSQARGGRFKNYHPLRLYYVGYGANHNSTTRFRRYLGTGERPVLPEHDLDDEQVMLKYNVPLKIQLIADGNRIAYLRGGEVIYDVHDPEPYTDGWFGFRTVNNHMTLDNFRIYRIKK